MCLPLPHKLPTPPSLCTYPMISRVSQLHSAKLSRCCVRYTWIFLICSIGPFIWTQTVMRMWKELFKCFYFKESKQMIKIYHNGHNIHNIISSRTIRRLISPLRTITSPPLWSSFRSTCYNLISGKDQTIRSEILLLYSYLCLTTWNLKTVIGYHSFRCVFNPVLFHPPTWRKVKCYVSKSSHLMSLFHVEANLGKNLQSAGIEMVIHTVNTRDQPSPLMP